MSTGPDDFDVFVLTYNRANYLPATLESILAQTIGFVRITVLDNASEDNTATAIAPYTSKGVRYVRSQQNVGWRGNLAKAQQLAERSWTMAFHDDDLLHPGYLSEAAKLIDRIPNLALITSSMTFDSDPNAMSWPALPMHLPRTCARPSDFARLLYQGQPVHFGSAVYRTSIFRALKWGVEYGKVADRPFLVDAAAGGATVVLPDAYVRYRLHPGQDSVDVASGPYQRELVALHARYKQLLGTSISSRNGRAFLSRFFSLARDEYSRLPLKERRAHRDANAYIEVVRHAIGMSPTNLVLSRLFWLVLEAPRQLARSVFRRGKIAAVLRRPGGTDVS